MIPGLHLAAAAGYLASWALEVRAFRAGDPAPRLPALLALGAGVGLHLAALVAFILVHGTLPLVGPGPASSTLAFLIGAVALGASLRSESRPAGLFLVPPLLLLLGEAVLVGIAPVARQTGFRGPWFVFHVGSIFAGYAALLLASAAATMYLLQFRALKRKRFGAVFGFFPSLDALDRLNRLGLLFGLPVFTLGLLAGWSWTLTYGGSGLALGNPEVALGIVTWAAYLAALVGRLAPRWRGTRPAAASAAAFLVTLMAFLLLRLTAATPGSFL